MSDEKTIPELHLETTGEVISLVRGKIGCVCPFHTPVPIMSNLGKMSQINVPCNSMCAAFNIMYDGNNTATWTCERMQHILNQLEIKSPSHLKKLD